MTSIFTQYDPEWEAYKASMGPGPIQTAQEKADQEKLNASLQNLYSQSLSSRNYLTPDQFNAMFPGVKKWGQEQSDWQKQLEEGFAKKYGHSPILSTSIQGPRNLLNSTQAPVGQPLTPPATTAPVTIPSVTTPPIVPPSNINQTTTSAVTPPADSPLSTNLLVTRPGATAAQNTIASLQNLLGRSAVGEVGSFKMPDFFKQTQQKWGGFSPTVFGKR